MAQMQSDTDLRKRLAINKKKAGGFQNDLLLASDGPAQPSPDVLRGKPTFNYQYESGGVAPPVIRPPVMDDWRANAAPRAAEQPAQAGPVDEARKQIELKRLRDVAQNNYLRAGAVDFTKLDPDQKEARIQAIRENREVRENIDGALRPSISPQSPEQIAAARTSLRTQGQEAEAKKRIELLARMKADPSLGAKLQPELDRTYQIAADLDKNLPDLTPEQAAEISRRQGALREKQDVSKAAYASMADQDLAAQRDAIALRTRLNRLQGETVASGMAAENAENRARAAQAGFDADPRVMDQELRAKLAMAQAKAAQAQGMADAYGRGTSPEAAGVAMQQEQAALGLVGLDNQESYNEFIAQAGKNLEALTNGVNSGEALKALELQTIPTLEQLAQLAPERAAREARKMLGMLGSGAPGIGGVIRQGFEAGTLAGPVFQQQRMMQSAMRESMRQRLQKIAGIGR